MTEFHGLDTERQKEAKRWAMKLSNQAEALVRRPSTTVDATDYTRAISVLPLEDLVAIALTAHLRGFGSRAGVKEHASLLEPFCETGLTAVVPPLDAWPNALERIEAMCQRHGDDWYPRDLLRYVEQLGDFQVDSEGRVVYRVTFE